MRAFGIRMPLELPIFTMRAFMGGSLSERAYIVVTFRHDVNSMVTAGEVAEQVELHQAARYAGGS